MEQGIGVVWKALENTWESTFIWIRVVFLLRTRLFFIFPPICIYLFIYSDKIFFFQRNDSGDSYSDSSATVIASML